MALDLGVGDLGERGRLPARRVVLVDDHRAHALVEIMAVDDARHYAEFGAHARRRNRSAAPRRTCASASLRLSGDFVRDRGGGLAGPFGVGAAGRRLARRARRGCPRRVSPANSRSIAARRAAIGPSARRLGKSAEHGIDRDRAGQSPRAAPESAPTATRWVAMPGSDAVGGVEALAGQRAIGAELARHARQEPGGADVGKEADADLRHGEGIAVAGDAVRAVHRNADAAAHDDAVDQRDIGLAVVLDRGVERDIRRARSRAPRLCRPALPRS